MTATHGRLHEFFVVTKHSIYHARDGAPGYPYALVTKIAERTPGHVPVGGQLKNGTMAAVCTSLYLYQPEGSGVLSPTSTVQRDIAMVNMKYWGGHTSPIVALFLDRKEAEACLRSRALRTPDRRWWAKTQEVIAAIGSDHPNFTVCTFPSLRLALPGSTGWPAA